MNLRHLQKDAPVRVFERDSHPPEGGWKGIVTSVGRKYLVVAFARGDDAPKHEIRVKREDGCSPDQWIRFWVQTPEVADTMAARRKNQGVLRSVGLTLNTHQAQMSNDLLFKLAAVIQNQKKPEDDSGTG